MPIEGIHRRARRELQLLEAGVRWESERSSSSSCNSRRARRCMPFLFRSEFSAHRTPRWGCFGGGSYVRKRDKAAARTLTIHC